MIFILTLTSYINLADVNIIDDLSNIMPQESYSLVKHTIDEIMLNRSSTLLSLGFLLSFWSALNGIHALMTGMTQAYGKKETRSFIRLKFVSLNFLVSFFLAIILSFILLVLGQQLTEYLRLLFGNINIITFLWQKLHIVFQFVFLILTFMYLNRLSTDKEYPFLQLLPGSIFSAIGWVLISMGFSLYLKYFNNYSLTYGSIGGIFILLLWLYWSSEIILFGCVLNSVIMKFKNQQYIE
jgi:membrane protein